RTLPTRPPTGTYHANQSPIGRLLSLNASLPLDVLVRAVMTTILLSLKHTRDGRALGALAQDLNAARMMGVRVPFMVMICFLIGSALAGVAGVLIGYKYGHLTPLSGFLPALKGFVAAVIGGDGLLPRGRGGGRPFRAPRAR